MLLFIFLSINKLTVMKNLKLIVLSVVLIFAFGCENEGGENETKISSFNDNESHNFGKNCMSCHISGGEGEGWFNVAGSIYGSDQISPFSNATIEFYTEANGQGALVKTVEGDALGNFYTTEEINFSSGLYPVISDGLDKNYTMNSSVNSGACTSCHGSSTEVLYIR